MATAAASISPHIVALVVLGLVRVRRGDPGQWAPLEEDWALADAGQEEPLRQAMEELVRLGARPAADAVAGRLRELGVRRLPRRPRRATAANPAGLTARELEVLALLGPGLRNGSSSTATGMGNQRRQDREPAARSWGPAPDVTEPGLLDTPVQPDLPAHTPQEGACPATWSSAPSPTACRSRPTNRAPRPAWPWSTTTPPRGSPGSSRM